MTLQYPFLLTVLQRVSADRLQKAVNALAEDSLSIALTRQTPTEIRALVKNGANLEYGLTLTPSLITCSCRDALYRGVVCKHAAVVALHLLRTPGQPEPPVVDTQPPLHLMWRNGIMLCGMWDPKRVWVWPWTENVWNWSDICTDCKAAWKARSTLALAA